MDGFGQECCPNEFGGRSSVGQGPEIDGNLVVRDAVIPSGEGVASGVLDDGSPVVRAGEREHVVDAGDEGAGGEHHLVTILAAEQPRSLSLSLAPP